MRQRSQIIDLLMLSVLAAMNVDTEIVGLKPVGFWPFTPNYQGRNVMGTGDAKLQNISPANGVNDAVNSALYLTGLHNIKIPFDQLEKGFGNGSSTVTMYLNSEDGDIGDIWDHLQFGTLNTGFRFRLFLKDGTLQIENKVTSVQSPAGTIHRNKWYYLAAVIDNDAKWMGIYRDLDLVAETTFSRPFAPAVGGINLGWRGWKARIFCAQLFNVSLTKSQIKESRETCRKLVFGCRRREDGTDYTGNLAVTASFTSCQSWTTHTPHQHEFADRHIAFPDETVEDARNYCRNPDEKSKPWCYTTNPKVVWEYCDVPICNGTFVDVNWIPIVRRVSSDISFERNWDEYVKGFGNVQSNYWIGLERIHRLTCCNKQTSFRVKMWDWDNNLAFAEYSHFKVENASTNYRMTVSGYSGTAGDSLASNNGMQFSTMDSDNDRFPKSCSQEFKGGWWYNACHHGNPTGIYYNPPTAYNFPYATGITWFHWKGYNYSLKKIIIYVRAIA